MSGSDRERTRSENAQEGARWWTQPEPADRPAGSTRDRQRGKAAGETTIWPFHNRRQAGRALASRLVRQYGARRDVVVLGLPRGGVPVAYEAATALEAPLDVFVVRKLGTPGEEEFAMGAIASGGVCVLNDEAVQALGITPEMVEWAVAQERPELERRERLYRGGRGPLDVAGRTVLVVDDGLATGSTMRAAVAALRRLKPARIVVAVPTAAPSTCDEFRGLADDCVCVICPEPFRAVGCWYFDFAQTTDEEVCELLEEAWRRTAGGPPGSPGELPPDPPSSAGGSDSTSPPTYDCHGERQP